MEPYIGSIMVFAGNFPPRGWAFCDGALMSISQNTALFSILGTTYGGDGKVTFGLPDLRGRVGVSSGQGPGLSNRDLGEEYGSNSAVMLSSNMPPHTHVTTGTAGLGANSATSLNSPSPVNSFLSAQTDAIYAGSSDGSKMGNSTVTPGQNTTPTGQGLPFNITQPSLGLNYCIALEGIYPARN